MTYNPTFSYFANDIKASGKLGDVRLSQMIRAIKNPKPEIMQAMLNVAYYSEMKDEISRNYWKTKLYSFTPAVQVFQKRQYNDIQNFTGLMPIDFDKFESKEFAKEFKECLFDTFDSIIACWLSSSKLGVRALVKIPIVDSTSQFKEYFEGFKQHAGALKGFDSAPKNCVLPLFLSHDPELLFRDDYTTWTQKKLPEPPQHIGVWEFPEVDNDKVFSKIKKAIDNITDNGHPQLRAAAFTLGGYVGGGSVDYSDSITFIENMIDCNAYLSQKAEVYKKTAKEMINKGQLKPIYK